MCKSIGKMNRLNTATIDDIAEMEVKQEAIKRELKIKQRIMALSEHSSRAKTDAEVQLEVSIALDIRRIKNEKVAILEKISEKTREMMYLGEYG